MINRPNAVTAGPDGVDAASEMPSGAVKLPRDLGHGVREMGPTAAAASGHGLGEAVLGYPWAETTAKAAMASPSSHCCSHVRTARDKTPPAHPTRAAVSSFPIGSIPARAQPSQAHRGRARPAWGGREAERTTSNPK